MFLIYRSGSVMVVSTTVPDSGLLQRDPLLRKILVLMRLLTMMKLNLGATPSPNWV